jgi:RHS repeat-associated protein
MALSGALPMHTRRETLLCRYHYDPLDRLVDCIPSKQANTQRFYLKGRLATEIQGAVQRSIMQHDDQLLAQQQRHDGGAKTTLLATDQQRSVLNGLDATSPRSLAYTPYGHRSPEGGLLSLLGFNGEPPDPVTGCYLLGNGYRAFNPVLMRFNSPDSWSPFGEGGINAYAYCVGDPVNLDDRTGHFGNPWKGLLNLLNFRTPRMTRATQAYNMAMQTPLAGLSARAPMAAPAKLSASIYSSVGLKSSSELPSSLPSSGYASVQPYSSVDAPVAPSLPHRPPPGNSRTGSVFSVQNPERIPSGRALEDIRNWVEETRNFSNEMPQALSDRSVSIVPLAIQDAGHRLGRNIRMNTKLYQEGIFPVPLEDLRNQFREKYISKIRKR